MTRPTVEPVALRRRVIALARLIAIVASTLVVALSLALSKLLTRDRLWRELRNRHFAGWSGLMIWILGGRIVVHGTPPSSPFFLASNHLGYLDILVLARCAPSTFVSKAEVRHWPAIGWLTRLADTHFIHRERRSDIPRANASIANAIARGDSVTLFPEGTSSESDLVLPVRGPLLDVAARESLAVEIAALFFETDDGDPHAHRTICYYGDMVFATHVWALLHLRGFTVTVRYADAPVRADNRKQLAALVETSIRELQLQNPPNLDPFSESTRLINA